MTNLDDNFIGTLVQWTVGNKTRKGIFKRVNEQGLAEVKMTSVEGHVCIINCEVPKHLIELQEQEA